MTKLNDTEWQVLTVLWQTGGTELPVVVDALRLKYNWSRKTVFTYLIRMEKKGLVAIDKGKYPHVYRAAVDRDACRADARQNFLEQVYQGSAGEMVAAFLREQPISNEERDRLRKLLDEMEV